MVETNIPIMMPDKRAVKIICGLIILISGIIIGAGSTVMMIKHRVIFVDKVQKEPNDIAAKIAIKYSLNEQQILEVQKIMNKAFAQRRAFDAEQDKRRDDYAQVIISEMNSIMTPEQFAQWNKGFQEMRAKYKSRK
ncbi:MAG: hypothetical protein A2Y12_07190 [Planctomycetes bacterium GWF2_42_9]|nr:MAG: hypothetical protein A2Y12_07190 [Planctomycetes bacterium GWF2_42_9]HAL45568.1 hypothetical protein [Phycisphaerales bacterium]